MFSRCFLDFSVGEWAFVIGLGKIFLFVLVFRRCQMGQKIPSNVGCFSQHMSGTYVNTSWWSVSVISWSSSECAIHMTTSMFIGTGIGIGISCQCWTSLNFLTASMSVTDNHNISIGYLCQNWRPWCFFWRVCQCWTPLIVLFTFCASVRHTWYFYRRFVSVQGQP